MADLTETDFNAEIDNLWQKGKTANLTRLNDKQWLGEHGFTELSKLIKKELNENWGELSGDDDSFYNPLIQLIENITKKSFGVVPTPDIQQAETTISELNGILLVGPLCQEKTIERFRLECLIFWWMQFAKQNLSKDFIVNLAMKLGIDLEGFKENLNELEELFNDNRLTNDDIQQLQLSSDEKKEERKVSSINHKPQTTIPHNSSATSTSYLSMLLAGGGLVLSSCLYAGYRLFSSSAEEEITDTETASTGTALLIGASIIWILMRYTQLDDEAEIKEEEAVPIRDYKAESMALINAFLKAYTGNWNCLSMSHIKSIFYSYAGSETENNEAIRNGMRIMMGDTQSDSTYSLVNMKTCIETLLIFSSDLNSSEKTNDGSPYIAIDEVLRVYNYTTEDFTDYCKELIDGLNASPDDDHSTAFSLSTK